MYITVHVLHFGNSTFILTDFYMPARLQTGRIMLWCCPSEFVQAITNDPLCRFEQYFTRLLSWT
jgi:hypothetical protein